MDVIGQHLLDADWLTFGTLKREDYAASIVNATQSSLLSVPKVNQSTRANPNIDQSHP